MWRDLRLQLRIAGRVWRSLKRETVPHRTRIWSYPVLRQLSEGNTCTCTCTCIIHIYIYIHVNVRITWYCIAGSFRGRKPVTLFSFSQVDKNTPEDLKSSNTTCSNKDKNGITSTTSIQTGTYGIMNMASFMFYPPSSSPS